MRHEAGICKAHNAGVLSASMNACAQPHAALHSPTPTMSTDHQTKKSGLDRVLSAFTNSCNGLRAACKEAAFRQELVLAVILTPAAFWVGQSWLEVCFLIGTVLFVLVTEILNSAIEAVVDRVGPEWHVLSKNAKDLGSAAVLLALAFCLLAWAWALHERFFS